MRKPIAMRLRALVWLVLPVSVFAVAAEPQATQAPLAARTLVMVRHGIHSLEPVTDPKQGPPLTAQGRNQAQLAASRLGAAGYHFDAVVASPLSRSQETGRIILSKLTGATLVTLDDLTECTPPASGETVPVFALTKDPQECAAQLDRVFAEYFQPARGAETGEVLVAHANVIRYLVAKALGVEPTIWPRFSVSHASLTTVRIEPDGSIFVLGVGDVGHIPLDMRSGSVGDAVLGSRRRR